MTWTYDHADSPWHVAFTPGMRALDVVTGDGEVLVADGRPTRVDVAEVRAHAAEQAPAASDRPPGSELIGDPSPRVQQFVGDPEPGQLGLGVDALVVGELDEVAVGIAQHADVADGLREVGRRHLQAPGAVAAAAMASTRRGRAARCRGGRTAAASPSGEPR